MKAAALVLSIAFVVFALAAATPTAEATPGVPCLNGGSCPVPTICPPGQYCCRYPEPCMPPPN